MDTLSRPKDLRCMGFKHMIPGLQGFVHIKRMYIILNTQCLYIVYMYISLNFIHGILKY